MSNPLVSKTGIDVNGHPYTRNVRADDPSVSAENAARVSKVAVPPSVPVKATSLDADISWENNITFTTPDGDEVTVQEPVYTPEPFAGVYAEQVEEGVYRVVYATRDDYPGDVDVLDTNIFEVFRTEWDRDAFIEEKVAEGHSRDDIFIIDKYDHGSVHYSISNTKNYPDRQWDVAPCGVFVHVPDPDSTMTEEEKRQYVNNIMDDYSEVSNGNVYGVIEQYVDEYGDTLAREGNQTWGFVGTTDTRNLIENNEVF
jgi:hypothetical protein